MDTPEITAKFNQLGGSARFGAQLGPEKDAVRVGEEAPVGKSHVPPHSGRVRHYKNGSIYWHKKTGAHAVFGLIRQKYDLMGGHRGFLEFPVTDEVPTAGKDGQKTTFEGGAVVWRSGTKEAFEVHGDIREKYKVFKGTTGLLGYPLTDAITTPDGFGRFNHFEQGSIYWKSSIGAHEVHGAIRAFWGDNGWEKNTNLGYPISDELPAAPGSADRYGEFENGLVYWKSGTKKAVQRPNDGNLSVPSINVPGIAANNIGSLLKNVNKQIAASNPPVAVTVRVSAGPNYYGTPEQALDLRTTDYGWNGSRVVNRRHVFDLKLDVDVKGWPNPSVDMTLNVEVNLNKARTAVIARLIHFDATTEVDFPLDIFYTADDLNTQLKAAVQNVGPSVVQTIPPLVRILSVKTMRGGNILVYR